MKITVVLLAYSSTIALQKALESLSPIQEYVDQTYLITDKMKTQINKSLNQNLFAYRERSDFDMGAMLNQVIPTLTSHYVLFLFDHQVLMQHCAILLKWMENNHSIMTHDHDTQEGLLRSPFFVKTTYLQQGPRFFTKEQIPFSEAVLPAWLSQVPDSDVVSAPTQVVLQLYKKQKLQERAITTATSRYRPRITLDSTQPVAPTLTVLLSTYNMARYVQIALGSLHTQSMPAEQILVIDDGSIDQTSQVLRAWEGVPGIQIRQTENGGKARALNHLLPDVTSDFVLELDADDWLDPDALETIRQKLLDMPDDVVLMYGNLRQWKELSSGELWYKGIQKGRPVHLPAKLTTYPLPLGPRIYRTSALLQVGGFPVVPFADGRLYEDVLVLQNLMHVGRILYKDMTVYNVRDHSGSITKKNQQKWSEFRRTFLI